MSSVKVRRRCLQFARFGFGFDLCSHITRLVLGFSCIAFLANTIFVYAKIDRVMQLKVRVKENEGGANERRKLLQYQ